LIYFTILDKELFDNIPSTSSLDLSGSTGSLVFKQNENETILNLDSDCTNNSSEEANRYCQRTKHLNKNINIMITI
jgi:hypothetical protein